MTQCSLLQCSRCSSSAHFRRGPLYEFDPSTRHRISLEPLLRDPYETQYCYVRNSKIKGAQEGLFARKKLPKSAC